MVKKYSIDDLNKLASEFLASLNAEPNSIGMMDDAQAISEFLDWIKEKRAR